MDITEFFNTNKQLDHNAASKDIPAEFILWESSPVICKNFFNWIRNDSNTGSLKLDIISDGSRSGALIADALSR
jgi:hypothetical protein